MAVIESQSIEVKFELTPEQIAEAAELVVGCGECGFYSSISKRGELCEHCRTSYCFEADRGFFIAARRRRREQTKHPMMRLDASGEGPALTVAESSDHLPCFGRKCWTEAFDHSMSVNNDRS